MPCLIYSFQYYFPAFEKVSQIEIVVVRPFAFANPYDWSWFQSNISNSSSAAVQQQASANITSHMTILVLSMKFVPPGSIITSQSMQEIDR